ncbi:MAG: helicase-related protein [Candidatus Odinarchaeota archaeon]
MVSKINPKKNSCPFCGNALLSRFSKCFNTYCQGQKFNLDNLVIFRLNPELSMGRIIKKLEIPISKSLDEEDTIFITKFKVVFKNNIIKIIHPIDLIHNVFGLNEKIITKEGIGVINSKDFLMKDGKISYEILFSNGKVSQIEESEIISLYESTVKSIISNKRFDDPQNFLIRYWANLFHSYYTSYQIKCITNSRLSLMPHQINVAHRLSEEYYPRVILADEVGLGKTIEAGIFIKEMMARNLAERILIIVPASLSSQWAFEMLNKFNIEFTIYDGKKIKELKRKGHFKSFNILQNPFYYDNLIICSLQFARNPKYIEFLTQISWDIVIFDEAHHLRRYLLNVTTGNYRETLNYQLARNLSSSTESMLLLTATPLQLHSFELYSLIELIQREAFESFSNFEHFRMNMPFINLLVSNINQIDKLNNFEVNNTIKLLKNLDYVDKKKNDKDILNLIKDDSFKLNLLKRVEKDHTLWKFLIRNRKKNVFSDDLLNKRIVKTIMVNPSKQELEIYNEIRLYLARIYNSSISKENIGLGFIITTLQKLITSSKYAFLKSLERRLEQIERDKRLSMNLEKFKEEDPEYFVIELEEENIESDTIINFNKGNTSKKQEISLDLINQEKMLKEFYDKLKSLPYDSKSNKLIELITQIYDNNSNEKILIFTQFVDTLTHLKQLLEKQEQNIEIETFYGGMDKDEKDKAVERFRASKKFSIMISTEIGGEGRNFQFCRVLINYDLPWNPMKLEQRIGRLDRIGQESKEIYIYNFFLEGTIETDIIFALNKRINLFEESIGILEPIIGKIEKDIKEIIFTESEGKKRKKLNQFYRTLDEQFQRAKEIEMRLDDLLIDKKSFRMDDLITSLEACEEVKLTHNELYLLMKCFFDLNNHTYGYLETSANHSTKSEVYTRIQLDEKLLKNPNLKFSKEYIGTFNLDFAREREEIDFFALGHPLINNIINFCRSDTFKGTFTLLNLRKGLLPKDIKISINNTQEVYILIFNIKFQGYIIENQYISIIVDKIGNEIENLADFVLDIENFNKIFEFKILNNEKLDLNQDFMETIIQKAKSTVKKKTSIWKQEIKALNDKIFTSERNKKEKIHQYKSRALNLKIEGLKRNLERKEKQMPTERQLRNISNLTDEGRKEEKKRKVRELEEDIQFLNKDIRFTEKKIDDLLFEYEDIKREMIKRNLAKFYTNLDAFAIIRLVD